MPTWHQVRRGTAPLPEAAVNLREREENIKSCPDNWGPNRRPKFICYNMLQHNTGRTWKSHQDPASLFFKASVQIASHGCMCKVDISSELQVFSFLCIAFLSPMGGQLDVWMDHDDFAPCMLHHSNYYHQN